MEKTKNKKLKTCDMKIVTAKYNPELNKSRKKKSIHQKLTPDYSVWTSFHKTKYICTYEYLHNLIL